MFFRKSKMIKSQQEEIDYLRRMNNDHNNINRWNIDAIQKLRKENKELKELLDLYKSVIYRENE